MSTWKEENLLRRVRESKNTDKIKKAYKNYARLSDQIENYRIKNCTFINGMVIQIMKITVRLNLNM